MKERIRGFLKISRISGWGFAPLVFLAGFIFSRAVMNAYAGFQLLLLSFPFAIFLYGLNDLNDIVPDSLNPRKIRLGKGQWENGLRSQLVQVISVIGLLLLASAILTLNWWNIMGMLLLLFFAHQYSAAPLRLKEKPILDSVSCGFIYYFAPFLIGASYNATLLDFPKSVYLIFLCMIGIHAFSTVMDYTADLQAGSTTFAVVFGKRLAASFLFIVFSITLQSPEFQRFPIGLGLLVGAIFSFVIVIYPSEKLAHVFLKLMALIFTTLAIFVLIYNATVLDMI